MYGNVIMKPISSHKYHMLRDTKRKGAGEGGREREDK
jgi:hypothetical protein